MKAEELRIGNWIFDGEEYQKITGIEQYRIHNKYGWFLLDMVEPIPLTPEILEKAGFVKVEGKDSIYDKGQMRLYLGLNGSLCYTEYEKGSYCYLRLIQYAHELQNLHYALYGSELPINL